MSIPAGVGSAAQTPAVDPAFDWVSAFVPDPMAELPSGPFPFRVLHPLFAPFHYPTADRATTLPAGVLRVSWWNEYSSMQRSNRVGADQSDHDGEFWRTALYLRYGITDALELFLELPFHTSGSGFLDNVIKGFHNNTRTLDDTRDEFEYREALRIGTETVLDESPRDFELADIPLSLKLRALEDGPALFGLSLRGTLELPTGRASRWTGSSSVEGSVGLLLQKRIGELTFYGHADMRFLEEPRELRQAGLDVTSTPVIGAALQWRPHDIVALVAQIEFSESIIGGSDLKIFENDQTQVGFGVRFRMGRRAFGSIGIVEDLLSVSSPDVAFFSNFGVDL